MKPNDLLVTPEQWEIIIDILNRNFDVDEVFAFGSRVKGQPKKFSDLDLMIKDSDSFNLKKLKLRISPRYGIVPDSLLFSLI